MDTATSLEQSQRCRSAINSLGKMGKVKNFKCVAVGDRGVGKSSLFSTFTDNELYHEQFDFSTSAFVIVDGKPIRLTMSDTNDDIDDAKKKSLSNQPTDVILLCFSLVNSESFENVLEKWHPLVRYYYPKTPIILVGTKLDLRGNLTSITIKQGESSATKIKAVKYLECSALNRPSVQVVVEEAARVALKSRKKKKENCYII